MELQKTSFLPLCTDTALSTDELRTLVRQTVIGKVSTDLPVDAKPLPELSTSYEIRHNIAVDVSKFPNFEAALKKFSALSKREGLMPKQRQFEAQGERMVSQHRAGRSERTVLPVSPLVAATIRGRRRKAMRGELEDARSRVKPREIESPVSAIPASTESEPATPEISAQFSVPAPSYSSPARRQFATGPREEVMIFIEFLESTPKFGLIKDTHKALIGFPFGGVDDPEQEIVGQTPLQGGLREAREEFFFNLPVMLSAGEENIFATMPGPEGGTVHLLHLQVPAGTPYAHGSEQTHSGLFTEAQVDNIIAERLMLAKHRDGWHLFQEKVLRARS